jgi:hypothetical protein
MGQNTNNNDAHPVVEPTDDETSHAVVVPSADVLAIVRFDDPPHQVPEELVAFVVREGDDWVLTDDAVAFGRPDIIERFALWRSTWERSWVLDPASSFARLIGLTEMIDPDSSIARELPGQLDLDGDLILSPPAQKRAVADLIRLADRIRERGAEGYGIVDHTPGAARVGLARAWPAWGREEIVAADQTTEIRFDPSVGLLITTRTELLGDETTTIEQVAAEDSGFRVTGPDGSFLVPAERARPLAWLMPRSTAWRVRRVPEIVTWARTLSGLQEASAFAADLNLDLRLTRHRPILR